MRVLIFGLNGMLGHRLYAELKKQYDTWATTRSPMRIGKYRDMVEPEKVLSNIDVNNFDTLTKIFSNVKPDVIVNCVGIVKQLPESKDPLVTLPVNSIFPHRLANLCKLSSTRLIHISTDCVFSGKRGMYTEQDMPDAEDLYGQSKHWGEVTDTHCLTIRSSIIGRELNSSRSLVDWFLSQDGKKVKGFRNAIYTGLTTLEMSRLIAKVIQEYPKLSGLYQVASERIDKYELLCLLRDAFNLQIDIQEDTEFKMDRSLDGSRFTRDTNYTPPSWKKMIDEMAEDCCNLGLYSSSIITRR